MPKQSAMLKKLENRIEAKYRARFWREMAMVLQMALDASFLAAADVFHLGSGRAERFGFAIQDYVNEISGMMYEDQKSDRDYVYTREKVDQRLKQICGDKFLPWEKRYGR